MDLNNMTDEDMKDTRIVLTNPEGLRVEEGRKVSFYKKLLSLTIISCFWTISGLNMVYIQLEFRFTVEKK